MTVRTVTGSVLPVDGPPANAATLEAEVAALRARLPGVIVRRYLAAVPRVHARAWVAEGAVLEGDVELGPDASVWYGCVLRADLAAIRVGARSNLQDGTVVHLGDHDPTIVGEDVVVGHRAVLHGCTIEDACLIGIGATVLDGAVIGRGSLVGAGAVVPAGLVVPPRSLVLGLPAKVVRPLDESAETFHRALAAKYVRLVHNHREG